VAATAFVLHTHNAGGSSALLVADESGAIVHASLPAANLLGYK
jgi:hypothetical protein